MPSAGRPKAALQPNQDGSVTIQYVPIQSGVHELNVTYNDAPVEGLSSSPSNWQIYQIYLQARNMRDNAGDKNGWTNGNNKYKQEC